MSDIQQRIADILRQHSLTQPQAEYADFVAEVITTELGLTQEWALETPLGGISPPQPQTEESARQAEQKYPGQFFAITRHVTPWKRPND